MRASYLGALSAGFSRDSGAASARYHFTQTFKLELLHAVTNVLTPLPADPAAAVAPAADAPRDDVPATSVAPLAA
ncbi:MAG: hypothetical protein RLW62_19710 [Gammaproteobacteria bacterium]